MAATNAASEADRAAEVVLARERWLAQALHEVDIADEADAALDAAEKLLRRLEKPATQDGPKALV